MFNKLRNRFLLLLMLNVILLTVLFFTAIVGSSYQSMEKRSDEMLSRGFKFHEKAVPKAITDRFSPIFSVDINEAGSITSIHSNFNMDTAFYSVLVQSINKHNKGIDKTTYEDMTFKYKLFELDEGGYRIVFLDISGDVQTVVNMIYSFVWIAIPLLGLIYLLSRYIANRAIKPIEQSFERQNQFIGDASHELKTPLATINANASLLLLNATPEQVKWLGFIKDETLRLEKLTTGLLYLSREPVTKSERVRCNLSEIINGVLMPLEAILYEKSIECPCDIEKDIFVMGTREKLERLVGIFLENAIKYTENEMSVTLKKQSRNVVLTVSNNGIGIPADDVDKIWDRFYRADKARENKGGFGLGLAMAKSIVGELGGSIKVSSVPGDLTTFTVMLMCIER